MRWPGWPFAPTMWRFAMRASLAVLARVRLGDFAEQRWGAPYLVAHRADLHSALIARASRAPDISIITDAAVRDFALHADGVTVSIDRDGKVVEASGRMLVAADGVWSSLRALAGDKGKSRFSGRIAWRAAVRGDGPAGKIIAGITEPNSVTAFLHPNEPHDRLSAARRRHAQPGRRHRRRGTRRKLERPGRPGAARCARSPALPATSAG